MAVLPGANDLEKLKALCSKTYKEQAHWFLNGYWDQYGGEAEHIWKQVNKLVDLDLQKRAAGNELDELNAHRFLEYFQETMTVQEMRNNLRSTGAIGANERLKMVPYTHYLIFKYKLDWHKLVNSAQGDNRKELEEAQRKLDAVQAAFREAEARADDAKKREAEARQAQAELEAALAELKAQEEAFAKKVKELKAKSEDPSLGLVARNRAANEYAQLLAEDPLPLRKAKITQEAAVKKAEKATAAAAEARTAAEAAVDEMQRKVEEAEAYLQEVRSRGGSAEGTLWWMERELQEARAYLPQKKGGYKK